MNITVTNTATTYIHSMLEKEQGIAFRLSIKKTGCSGYSYLPSIVNEIIESDLKHTLDNGLIILIDPKWQHLLENLNIDYIEEAKTGLKQRKLVFTNPSESSRCGCGESFHVE